MKFNGSFLSKEEIGRSRPK